MLILRSFSRIVAPGPFVFIAFISPVSARSKFDQDCYPKALDIWTGEGDNPLSFDPFYYGTPKSLKNTSWITNRTPKVKKSIGQYPYILLTKAGMYAQYHEFGMSKLTGTGCEGLCKIQPEYNDADEAFQILTTWVLPILALFSNLPFESLSKKKKRSTPLLWIR